MNAGLEKAEVELMTTLSGRLRYYVEGYSAVNSDVGVEGVAGLEWARRDVCYQGVRKK